MNTEVRYDEGNDTYELGAEIDGAFVVFATVPGTTVRSAQEQAKQNADRQTDEQRS